MLVAFYAKDKPGALDVRKEARPAHVEFLKTCGVVQQAGPLLDEAGEMCGSLVIIEVEDMAEAEAWAAQDPYAKAGLFAESTLIPWNRVINT